MWQRNDIMGHCTGAEMSDRPAEVTHSTSQPPGNRHTYWCIHLSLDPTSGRTNEEDEDTRETDNVTCAHLSTLILFQQALHSSV